MIVSPCASALPAGSRREREWALVQVHVQADTAMFCRERRTLQGKLFTNPALSVSMSNSTTTEGRSSDSVTDNTVGVGGGVICDDVTTVIDV